MVKSSANGKISTYPELDNRIQDRLNEINRIKDYFVAESHERETMSKALSKYIDFFYKTLLVLSETSGRVSIGSLAAGSSTKLDNNCKP